MRKIEKQFNDYIGYCRSIRFMSKQTIHNKIWTIGDFVKSVNVDKVEDISNQDIMEWIEAQAVRGCSGRTINIRVAHIIAALRYFISQDVKIPNLKLETLQKAKEMPTRRVFYSQEQIDKVLSYADVMEWLLISLSYDCGFRISELQSLRLDNINGQQINFIGKGSKSRETYMSAETRRRLDIWIERENITDYLWAARSKSKNLGEPYSVEEIRHRMRKPFYKAGFNDFYPHALRHSFATNICNNGAPLTVAQQMLGHSNIATTERYIHTFDGHLREYFDKYKFTVV